MEDIILTIRHPSKAALAPPSGSNRLLIDGISAWGSFPPWPSCPDILYDSRSRVLCGVAYRVHESDRALVKDLFRSMDHEVVRYREFSASATVNDLSTAPVLPSSQLAYIPWTSKYYPDIDFNKVDRVLKGKQPLSDLTLEERQAAADYFEKVAEKIGGSNEDEDYLEIVWAAVTPDTFALAQLADHTWFYTPATEVLALRVGGLDEIAQEYGLVLPDRFALPALEFSYLDAE